MSLAVGSNAAIIDDYYVQWKQDERSVDASWRAFFEGFELGGQGRSAEHTEAQVGVLRLIFAHRELGHRSAHLDPLGPAPPIDKVLTLERYGLAEKHLEQTYGSNFVSIKEGKLSDILTALRQTYCGMIGYDYMHIQDPTIRMWIQERIEPRRSQPNMSREQKLGILRDLHEAELFEKFLHNRFQGQKRFSLEGAETLIPLLNAFVERAPDYKIVEFILGMAHRGRLNVLANVLNKPYQEIFAEFEDRFADDSSDGDGDVKYHYGFSGDVMVRNHSVHLSLTPNPSHLEAVNSVVLGRTRAKQEFFCDGERKHGVPILIHGDAAFAAQGSVYETLNLARLDGYTVGGTIHVIVNNQIGFTTSPHDARSTQYCTDVAKAIQAPIFHVNAEDPETVVFIAELALDFRQTWGIDVLIDMYCYRRRGHNEGDEPAFTQPEMYRKIAERPSVVRVYSDRLISDGVLSEKESKAIDEQFRQKLDVALDEMRNKPPRQRGMPRFGARWKGFTSKYSHEPVATGISTDMIRQISERILQIPEGFTPHRKLYDPESAGRDGEASGERKTFLARLADMFYGREKADWNFSEMLAFGSLLLEKTPIRLTGQDTRRGTFTQRHAVLIDQESGKAHVPLNHLSADQAKLEVYDSPLSEFAVLGFEFGFTIDDPFTLVLWEAQFGDFSNGAQVIIDQFLASSESKWQRDSGLVLLLPHGYEGQGPEHSSARLERFLQLSADDNLQVVNCTTPAQYFHLLRRQMRRKFRKPLIVMTPKSLLRHPLAKSGLSEFATGQFREVLDDSQADPHLVRRVVLCSGKVYYDLHFDADGKKPRQSPPDVAIVRVEQFHPFPEEPLAHVLRRFRKATEIVWLQEEPQNMGGWSFIEPRLRAMLDGRRIDYVGRDASASPATGSYKIHKREQDELVEHALNGQVPHIVRAVKTEKAKVPTESKAQVVAPVSS